mmetsp:Transcript_36621/g.93530  ORF Transcript_36621/g.93530 Transcript_36621/m.93530 type:complete len:208 (-) Transcript_36621:85-708(-)
MVFSLSSAASVFRSLVCSSLTSPSMAWFSPCTCATASWLRATSVRMPATCDSISSFCFLTCPCLVSSSFIASTPHTRASACSFHFIRRSSPSLLVVISSTSSGLSRTQGNVRSSEPPYNDDSSRLATVLPVSIVSASSRTLPRSACCLPASPDIPIAVLDLLGRMRVLLPLDDVLVDPVSSPCTAGSPFFPPLVAGARRTPHLGLLS